MDRGTSRTATEPASGRGLEATTCSNPRRNDSFGARSVFRGGWTIEGRRGLPGEGTDPDRVFGALASLLDGSLIVRQAKDGTVSRFVMLETLREFAAERLDEAGEADDVRDRHAGWCRELVEGCEPDFTGPGQAAALDMVAIEHDNIRAALDHFLEAQPRGRASPGGRLWRFWQMRGHLVEGSRWLTRALEWPERCRH